MSNVSHKRERLLEAARSLIHEQGFKPTTLADIARKSDVPLGNVYYYFKTKDDIAAAVIKQHKVETRAFLARCEQRSDPRDRLIAFLDMPLGFRNSIAEYGCPVGSLCQELNKEVSPLSREADSILTLQLEWAQTQLCLLGRQNAEDLALHFIAALQGMSLLANALGDPTIVDKEIARLKRWIQGL